MGGSNCSPVVECNLAPRVHADPLHLGAMEPGIGTGEEASLAPRRNCQVELVENTSTPGEEQVAKTQ